MRPRACLAVVLLVLCSDNAPAAEGISVTVKPDVVYREMRGSLTRLNFDVEIHNGSDDALRLFEIELRVFDEDDRILTRRYMGGNGLPGPIAMLPDALAARPLPITFACVSRNGAERANAAVDSGDFVASCDAETRGE